MKIVCSAKYIIGLHVELKVKKEKNAILIASKSNNWKNLKEHKNYFKLKISLYAK